MGLPLTRHHREFTGIHPSGLPLHLWMLDGTAALGLDRLSFAPRRYQRRTSGWGQAIEHRPGLHLRHRRPPIDVLTQLVRPRVAPRSGDCRASRPRASRRLVSATRSHWARSVAPANWRRDRGAQPSPAVVVAGPRIGLRAWCRRGGVGCSQGSCRLPDARTPVRPSGAPDPPGEAVGQTRHADASVQVGLSALESCRAFLPIWQRHPRGRIFSRVPAKAGGSPRLGAYLGT